MHFVTVQLRTQMPDVEKRSGSAYVRFLWALQWERSDKQPLLACLTLSNSLDTLTCL